MARLKSEMTASDRPAALSQADMVSKTRKLGRPAAKPRPSMTATGRSPNTASAARKLRGFGAVASRDAGSVSVGVVTDEGSEARGESRGRTDLSGMRPASPKAMT